MTTSSIPYMKPPRRFFFSWIPGILIKPRQIFANITTQTNSWFTPMLVLTLAIVLHVWVAGWVNQKIAESGVIPTPEGFEYWTAEMQAQYMQSQQVRQGPVFLYVIPGIGAVTAAWIGWLIVGGMLHLATTLLGGRGETSTAVTLIAWSNVPIILRELVRAIYLFLSKRAISASGLSGLVDAQGGNANLFLASLLALIDIYLIWQIILIVIGVRTTSGLPAGKAAAGAISVIVIVLLAQTLISYGMAQLSSLSVIRPFFF